MYQWQPSKWILGTSFGALLPFLAAYVVQTGPLQQDVATRAAAAAGEGVKLKFDGRDVVLSGEVPSQEALDAAKKNVAGTYGVRLVDSSALKVVIPPPPAPPKVEPPKAVEPAPVPKPVIVAAPLASPTVTALITNNGKPEISGTYPVAAAALTVTVGPTVYTLGKDKELTAPTPGNWMLKPSTDLPDGNYAVVAKVADAAGTAPVGSAPTQITVDTKPPAAPSVTAAPADAVWPYAITGKWDETEGSKLAIDLNKNAYVLGKDKELISDGHGSFTFVPADKLDPGKYDLNITETDAAGNVTKFAVKDAVIVAAPPPPPPPKPVVAAAPPIAAPTVASITSDSDHPIVKGTWAAGVAKGLTVDLDGVKHKLGTDTDLLSDASGNWTLKPKAPVVNGTYDVVATETGADGKTVSDATKGEVVVKVAPPPPAPPAAQAYDCEGTLARIAAVFPVRFDFDKSDIVSPFDSALNQYVALLKDPRCVQIKIQVAGHADDRGSETYNQNLSEARAKTVIAALTKSGIDAGRLNGLGFGKNKPLDPSHTDDARRKNRRAEFTTVK